jgi:hypothetical protein
MTVSEGLDDISMLTYLGSAVLGSTLRGGELALPIALRTTIRWWGALGLSWGLGSTQHGTRNGWVNVWLVTRTGIVRLKMLLLAWGTLWTRALQVVLSS